MIFRSLRARIALFFVAGILILMTATLAVVIAQVQNHYTALFIQRGHVAAEQLASRADKLLQLGLAPDELLGFEKQCREIVLANEGVNYAALVDGHGNILYQSDDRPAWVYTRSTPPENASNGPGGLDERWIEHPLTQVPKSLHNKILIGLDRDVIDKVVHKLLRSILLIGGLVTLTGTFLVTIFLHLQLGRPAAKLLQHIMAVRPENIQTLPAELPLRADEIGTIAHAFDALVEQLARTQTELISANGELLANASILEQRVDERTEKLANANNELAASYLALEESESRYRLLIENQNDMVVKFDPEGRLQFASPVYHETFGTAEDQVLGQTFLPLTDSEGSSAARTAMEALLQPPYTASLEQQVLTRKGWRWLSWSHRAILDNKRRVTAIIGVGRDITQSKELQVERERMRKELEQARKMEAIGQLAGGIAHDFNNILGIIMGNAEMTMSRYGSALPEKGTGYLTTVINASLRAKELVAQMLTFSQNRGNSIEFLDIVPLVEESIDMLRSLLPSSITIEFSCEEKLPPVLIDRANLQQLVMNLCVNARDAMDGKGVLSIGLRRWLNMDLECHTCHKFIKGDWIEMSVTDTGCGMTPETVEHIFEPFFTTKEIGKGTGMGMAVLHGIIKSLKGHILIDTAPGQGTTFRLLFPLLVDATSKPTTAIESAFALRHGEGRHVLVVDDELQLAEYVGELLEINGYRITVRGDSQAALNLFQQYPDEFDLLVTDQTMPRLTGLELAREFRLIRPEVPVIICSGLNNALHTAGTHQEGILYLGKPIDSKVFLQSAGELLGIVA